MGGDTSVSQVAAVRGSEGVPRRSGGMPRADGGRKSGFRKRAGQAQPRARRGWEWGREEERRPKGVARSRRDVRSHRWARGPCTTAGRLSGGGTPGWLVGRHTPPPPLPAPLTPADVPASQTAVDPAGPPRTHHADHARQCRPAARSPSRASLVQPGAQSRLLRRAPPPPAPAHSRPFKHSRPRRRRRRLAAARRRGRDGGLARGGWRPETPCATPDWRQHAR